MGKEQDIDILTSIVKAITSAIFTIDVGNFFQVLSENCLRRFQVRELDFGQFKEKRDEAKDLRSLAFDLLEIGIDHIKTKGF